MYSLMVAVLDGDGLRFTALGTTRCTRVEVGRFRSGGVIFLSGCLCGRGTLGGFGGLGMRARGGGGDAAFFLGASSS